MTRFSLLIAVLALTLAFVAPAVQAGHDHPRYVTRDVAVHVHGLPVHDRSHGRGHRHGHGHGHGHHGHRDHPHAYRFHDFLAYQQAYQRAWQRQLRSHDRSWGRGCAFRQTPHRHVRVGGSVVIRFDW